MTHTDPTYSAVLITERELKRKRGGGVLRLPDILRAIPRRFRDLAK